MQTANGKVSPAPNAPKDARYMIARALLAAVFFTALLTGCERPTRGHGTDVTGAMPDLHFAMLRTNDEKPVTELDYRDRPVLLFFGYTHCPDICPTTLVNLSDALAQLGSRAAAVRILFVTVDPDRDSASAMKSYVQAFGPQIDGLRGSENALASLARRYRVTYGITRKSDGSVEVMHSDAVFVFDNRGKARIVETSTDRPDDLKADLESVLPKR